MNNEKGFTLVEMMIVLFIITVLLLITIPNVTAHQNTISKKGCEGLVNLVEAQGQAYWLDKSEKPDIAKLQASGYIDQNQTSCPDGSEIYFDTEGNVTTKAPIVSGS